MKKNIYCREKSFYLTNLSIAKKHVWQNPLSGFFILDKVTKMVMDEMVKEFPNKGVLPMSLIQIYERVVRNLGKRMPLKLRIKLYAEYSAKLHSYIEHHLGKGLSQKLFEIACKEALKVRVAPPNPMHQ